MQWFTIKKVKTITNRVSIAHGKKIKNFSTLAILSAMSCELSLWPLDGGGKEGGVLHADLMKWQWPRKIWGATPKDRNAARLRSGYVAQILQKSSDKGPPRQQGGRDGTGAGGQTLYPLPSPYHASHCWGYVPTYRLPLIFARFQSIGIGLQRYNWLNFNILLQPP